jgi:hypothetical protein
LHQIGEAFNNQEARKEAMADAVFAADLAKGPHVANKAVAQKAKQLPIQLRLCLTNKVQFATL